MFCEEKNEFEIYDPLLYHIQKETWEINEVLNAKKNAVDVKAKTRFTVPD